MTESAGQKRVAYAPHGPHDPLFIAESEAMKDLKQLAARASGGDAKVLVTGAHRDKVGKLQQANRGTIFLDEVGEMSLRMQALLLCFLESGEIQSVGADGGGTHVDVRVISATNRDLPTLISAGQFREDLLYRIRVIHLQVPPLRARREDIRPLIDHTIQKGGRPIKISEEAMQALER